MGELPIQHGCYALFMELKQSSILKVGRLGEYELPSGYYIYLGSARGPGGLRARLGRHLSGSNRFHWHIDYLREVTAVIGYGYIGTGQGNPPGLSLECQWSQALANQLKGTIPIPKFGASDCRSGCPAHLIYFKQAGFLDEIAEILMPTGRNSEFQPVVLNR